MCVRARVCLSPRVYIPTFVFLHSLGSVSALFDLSLSTGIHLHGPADRHDLSWSNDLLFQNLPSQLMKNPGKGQAHQG